MEKVTTERNDLQLQNKRLQEELERMKQSLKEESPFQR